MSEASITSFAYKTIKTLISANLQKRMARVQAALAAAYAPRAYAFA